MECPDEAVEAVSKSKLSESEVYKLRHVARTIRRVMEMTREKAPETVVASLAEAALSPVLALAATRPQIMTDMELKAIYMGSLELSLEAPSLPLP